MIFAIGLFGNELLRIEFHREPNVTVDHRLFEFEEAFEEED